MNTEQGNSIVRGVRFDRELFLAIEKRVEEIGVTTFNKMVNHFLRKGIESEIKKGVETPEKV